MVDFETVWRRLCAHEGAVFHLQRGDEFSYRISADGLLPSTLKAPIQRWQIEQAVSRAPLTSPHQLLDIWGTSHLFAILSDERIRGKDW